MNSTLSSAAPANPLNSSPVWTDRTSTAGLKRRSVRGAAVTGTSQTLKFAIRFSGTAILARLLDPADFGLVAMTAVLTNFLDMFTDAGLTAATIQRDRITHDQVSTLFWINAGLGLLLALFVAAVAPGVAWFYGDPRLTGICLVLAVTFVLGGLMVQHQALLRREMRFTILAVVQISAILFGTVLGVAMAYHGFGYWSLVGMAVGNALGHAIGVWIALPWRPGRARNLRESIPLLRFGSNVLTFNVLNYFTRNADNLLIGWVWGPAALGFYNKAYTLLLMPMKQINAPLGAVAIPAMARTRKEGPRCARFFLSTVQLIASISLPLVLVIALFADQLVLLWLGPKWIECATLFRLLAVAAAVGAINNPLGWFLVAIGATRRYRQLGVYSAITIVGAFLIGISHGPTGVALAYSIVMALLLVPTWWFVLRGTAVSMRAMAGALAPSLLSCVPATIIALLIQAIPLAGPLPWLADLFAGLGFVLTYTVTLLFGFRRWKFFKGILAELRG